ncbi:S1C family serine protease [Deinococcus pimensis]|uniref:S1C family serine protease n=1 Tax=Deinococcus pimensis TaxID=309888 RepID=UPI0004BA2E2E|nr:trypsin-like peptidase domain-containing protein [Deinococcus pimensis]
MRQFRLISLVTLALALSACRSGTDGAGAGTGAAPQTSTTQPSTDQPSTGSQGATDGSADSGSSDSSAGSGDSSATSTGTGTGTDTGTPDTTTTATGGATTGDRPADALAYEDNTVRVVQDTQNGVVFVTRFDQQNNLYNPLGGGSTRDLQPEPSGSGSGFFVDNQGYILTNYHVVEDAERITVRLHTSKKEYQAQVVGTAPDYDLALLRVKNVPSSSYTPMKLGDSTKLRAGQKAIALGAPFGLDFSVTQGIVSSVERTIPTGVNQIPQNAIQTDAAINPGNSGGPLVNSRGEVIGINTQILSPAGAQGGTGQSAGVGFAIPVNVAKSILPRLRAGERVSVPVIGVQSVNLADLNAQVRADLKLPEEGILVQNVVPDSPAQKAGVRGGNRAVQFPDGTLRVGGDVIVGIEGQEVSSVEDLQSVLITRKPGDRVTLRLRRGGQTVTEQLTLGQGTRR